jgi:hypothetical protein
VRLIVGISGASGVIYGIRLLETLSGLSEVETHLVRLIGTRAMSSRWPMWCTGIRISRRPSAADPFAPMG